jgi:hypothetical protein
MSHFTVLVITPNGTEQEAAALLAPYSEHINVEPYDTPCWCIGIDAKKSVRATLEKEMPIEKARDSFNAREDVQKLIDDSRKAGNYGFSEEVDRIWEETYEAPYEARQNELFAQHPDREAASSDCDECKGTGIENTTYNPKSKWDWYQLGGRWGELFGNLQGQSISAVLKAPEAIPTFALLTPDGQWYEQGKMMIYATVVDEQDPKEWQTFFIDILEKFSDHKALFYDCHI